MVYLYVWSQHRVLVVSWCCSPSVREKLSLCPPCGFSGAGPCSSRTSGKWTPTEYTDVTVERLQRQRLKFQGKFRHINTPVGSLWCECWLVWSWALEPQIRDTADQLQLCPQSLWCRGRVAFVVPRNQSLASCAGRLEHERGCFQMPKRKKISHCLPW